MPRLYALSFCLSGYFLLFGYARSTTALAQSWSYEITAGPTHSTIVGTPPSLHAPSTHVGGALRLGRRLGRQWDVGLAIGRTYCKPLRLNYSHGRRSNTILPLSSRIDRRNLLVSEPRFTQRSEHYSYALLGLSWLREPGWRWSYFLRLEGGPLLGSRYRTEEIYGNDVATIQVRDGLSWTASGVAGLRLRVGALSRLQLQANSLYGSLAADRSTEISPYRGIFSLRGSLRLWEVGIRLGYVRLF